MNKLDFALSNIYLFITFCHRDIVHVYFSSRILCSYKKHSCSVHCSKMIRALTIHLTCIIILNNIMTTLYNSKLGVEVHVSKATPISVLLRRLLRILKFKAAISADYRVPGWLRIGFRKDIRSSIELTFSYNCY